MLWSTAPTLRGAYGALKTGLTRSSALSPLPVRSSGPAHTTSGAGPHLSLPSGPSSMESVALRRPLRPYLRSRELPTQRPENTNKRDLKFHALLTAGGVANVSFERRAAARTEVGRL